MGFLILPAVDIQGGRCVRLFQGDYTRSTVYDDDPLNAALRWQAAGATWLHVVDLDGAASGELRNLASIERIVTTSRLAVEVSGGLRTLEQIESLLALGVRRIVLGTVAVEAPELVAAACRRWGDQIVLGLDARGGRVATRGWLKTTDLDAIEFGRRMVALGIHRIIATDIERDGTLTAPNFAALELLIGAVRVPVIASGGVVTETHVARLRALGAEGAIIGRALYDGTLTYAAARAAAEAPRREVAGC